MSIHDLTDPLVYQMAEENHKPEEVWVFSGDGTATGHVQCEKDRQPWPCPTRQALNKAEPVLDRDQLVQELNNKTAEVAHLKHRLRIELAEHQRRLDEVLAMIKKMDGTQ